MPFTKINEGPNKGKYRSPSGRIYTIRQIRAYHATKGWKWPVLKTGQLHQRTRRTHKVRAH